MFHAMLYGRSNSSSGIDRLKLLQNKSTRLEAIQNLWSQNLTTAQLKSVWLSIFNTMHKHTDWTYQEKNLVVKGLFNPKLEGLTFQLEEFKDLKATKEFVFGLIENKIAPSLELLREGSFLHNVMSIARGGKQPGINERSSKIGKIAANLEAFLGKNPDVDISGEFKSLLKKDSFAFASLGKYANEFPNIAAYILKQGYFLAAPAPQRPRNGR